jgi:hypothetical protein
MRLLLAAPPEEAPVEATLDGLGDAISGELKLPIAPRPDIVISFYDARDEYDANITRCSIDPPLTSSIDNAAAVPRSERRDRLIRVTFFPRNLPVFPRLVDFAERRTFARDRLSSRFANGLVLNAELLLSLCGRQAARL